MSERWRVRVEHHYNFALDQLNVWIGTRNDLGEVRMVKEVHLTPGVPPGMQVELGDPIDAYQATEPTIVIARELASALFDALTPVMLGTDSANVLRLVASLRRERDDANRRFDELLRAMSNFSPRATPPVGKPFPPVEPT